MGEWLKRYGHSILPASGARRGLSASHVRSWLFERQREREGALLSVEGRKEGKKEQTERERERERATFFDFEIAERQASQARSVGRLVSS